MGHDTSDKGLYLSLGQSTPITFSTNNGLRVH
jgi:hypothetical protein